MQLRTFSTLFALAVVLVGSTAHGAGDVDRLTADRDLLVSLFAGEFDNRAQVRAAGDAAPDHVHAAFAEVVVEDLAGPLVYGQMADGGADGEVFRQRLYAFDVDPEVDAVVMTIHRFRDEATVLDAHRHPERMDGVRADDLVPLTGCEILWRRAGDGFLGVSSGEPCLVAAGPRGEVQFFHRMEVDEGGLKLHEWAVDASGAAVWGAADEPPLELRRCRRFRGEVVIPGAAGGTPTTTDVELHDQGGRARIVGGGEDETYELELERSRPGESADPVLQLTVRRLRAGHGAEIVATIRTDGGASRLALDAGGLEVDLAAVEPGSADLDRLADWMTGSFASTAQATADDEYLDIRLRMAPIWIGRSDGRWFYVEQAVADYRDRPYRQRVYRVREVVPGLFESEVFTLPDPEKAVGAWRDPAPLAELEPGQLEPRSGCSILMRRRGDVFIGGTLGRLCPSERRGAEFATSEVRITPQGMISWDRGFAADGAQVWGATEGGYVFVRIGGPADPDPDPEATAPEPAASPEPPGPTEETPLDDPEPGSEAAPAP